MSKGIVTQHETICFICGRQAEAEHHLILEQQEENCQRKTD